MLSAPVRREINNDSGEARELRTYAQHSLYGGQQAIQETVYQRPESVYSRRESMETLYPQSDSLYPQRNYYGDEAAQSRKESIAMRLFGEDYDVAYETERAQKSRAADTGNPDLLPSSRTMNYQELRNYYKDEKVIDRVASQKTTDSTVHRAKSKVSTQTKILIAGYVAVVLALVLIITLAAVSISALFNDVAALQTELDTQMTSVSQMNERLDYAASPENIEYRAQTELGMVPASEANVRTYTQPVTASAPVFATYGNWFDSLTNWFSRLFN